MLLKLEVTDLHGDIDEELLELYFESKRYSGGGVVKQIDFDDKNRSAVIAFEHQKGTSIFIIKQINSIIYIYIMQYIYLILVTHNI